MKVAHVSTFPELKCGIAFYVSDLIEAMPTLEHRKYALHYGNNVTRYAAADADVSDPRNLTELARVISASDCEIVSLQHEFGIWGGVHGEYIHQFLDAITKPVVSTLHTTFNRNNRPLIKISILRRLVDQSEVCFVLTPRSRDTLCAALKIPRDAISVMPHGVPDIPFLPPLFTEESSDGRPPWKICSIGFFRPDKGIEEILMALSLLSSRGLHFKYVIAGAPQSQFSHQEAYLHQITDLIDKFQLGSAVRLDARFLSRAEQIDLIQRVHAGVFAYQDPDQSSSGAIPLVMATGRPVVCTPFEYAVAKHAEVDDGVIVAEDFSSVAIAKALTQLIGPTPTYVRRAAILHARTRHWTWQTVGSTYRAAFGEACA